MRRLYGTSSTPGYIDAVGATLLAGARAMFAELALGRVAVIADGDDSLVFPWRGDRVLDTLALALRRCGPGATRDGVGLRMRDSRVAYARACLGNLLAMPEPNARDLAELSQNKSLEKHDDLLGAPLLLEGNRVRAIDVPGAWNALRQLVG